MALTSICVLLVAFPFSIVLPNPIHDPNYLEISEAYFTAVDTWYSIEVRLDYIRAADGM
jgi:hypothetical protein